MGLLNYTGYMLPLNSGFFAKNAIGETETENTRRGAYHWQPTVTRLTRRALGPAANAIVGRP